MNTQDEPRKPEHLDPTSVQEIVAKAHGDLARVRELLAAEPKLINAFWD